MTASPVTTRVAGVCDWCGTLFSRMVDDPRTPVLFCKPIHRRKAFVKRKQLRKSKPCPFHPEKGRFITEFEALREVRFAGGRSKTVLFTYRCPGCRWWHLTKQPPHQTRGSW